MVSKSAKYYQEHPLARDRKKKYDSKFESSPSQKRKEGNLQNLTLLTTRSMVQLIAMGWTQVTRNYESGISHHR